MAEERLTPDELEELLQGEEPVTVVDVRSLDKYRAGHVPNAINIASKTLKEDVPDLPRDHVIVTY